MLFLSSPFRGTFCAPLASCVLGSDQVLGLSQALQWRAMNHGFMQDLAVYELCKWKQQVRERQSPSLGDERDWAWKDALGSGNIIISRLETHWRVFREKQQGWWMGGKTDLWRLTQQNMYSWISKDFTRNVIAINNSRKTASTPEGCRASTETWNGDTESDAGRFYLWIRDNEAGKSISVSLTESGFKGQPPSAALPPVSTSAVVITHSHLFSA